MEQATPIARQEAKTETRGILTVLQRFALDDLRAS